MKPLIIGTSDVGEPLTERELEVWFQGDHSATTNSVILALAPGSTPGAVASLRLFILHAVHKGTRDHREVLQCRDAAAVRDAVEQYEANIAHELLTKDSKR